jgi:hypothetical protein
MQVLWQDFLPKQRHCLSSTPASALYVRTSRSLERRGIEQVLDCASPADCLEHGGPLAGESCCVLSSIQHEKDQNIRIRELQADEIRTIVGGKEHPPVWIFAAIEVWSRLWPATIVGKRS